MAAVPAGCSRGPWDWWEWQKRASDSSSRGSGDQPRVLPRPSSRVPLARTNLWLSLLGLLARRLCAEELLRMAADSAFFQSVPRAGLRNTLSFRWKKEDESIPPREIFGKCVLKDLLKVKTEEVLCLQTGINKCYEVSFLTSAGCNQYHQECARLAGEKLLAGFEVLKLDKENFRVIGHQSVHQLAINW